MFLQLSNEQKDKIHVMAKQLLGVPYKFGAEADLNAPIETVKALDCSELVELVFHKLGLAVPDGACNQHAASLPVDKAEVGDLVFKTAHGTNTINHVGLVMSVAPIVIVEAEGWYGKVILTDFEKFSHPKPTANQYAGCRRFLAEKIKVL